MNLVPPEMALSIRSALKDVFDTFKRSKPVRFYKTAKEVVISDPNFSGDWDSYSNKLPKTAQYRDFYCVVLYTERQQFDSILKGNDEQLRGEFQYNRLKIQMEPDAYEYLKDSHRFVFDGIEYQRDGTFRGLGILDTIDFYELLLKKVN